MNEKKIGRARQMACETRARTHKIIETIMTRWNWLMQELAKRTYHQYFAFPSSRWIIPLVSSKVSFKSVFFLALLILYKGNFILPVLLSICLAHRILHLLFLIGSGGSSAAKMASSKTFFNPFCERHNPTTMLPICDYGETEFARLTWVRAEHSTYFTAFSSRASFSPWSIVITLCLFFANFSTVAASSRRSICVPTNKKGVFWQWCVISGTHYKTGVH